MKRYYLLVLPLILMLSRCAVSHDTAYSKTSGYTAQIQSVITESHNSKQPSGFANGPQENFSAMEESVFYAESALKNELYTSSKNINLITTPSVKDEKDSTEVEPKLEPLVVGGTALAIAGLGAAVAGIFGAPILFVGAALLLAASAFVTALGWKKIKADPKKFKGEKFALANYIIIGIIGVLSSFYLIWLLFDV